MRPKLTDVAELAGVSPTTVSRVINRKGYLSNQTIRKVHDAMEELNYQPNIAARRLQGKSAKIVGLVFPSLKNIFYAELIDAIEGALDKQGYKTIFCNSEYQADKEVDSIRMLLANQVDGIIVGSHSLSRMDYRGVKAPVVSFDRYLGDEIPIVSSDNYRGGQLATQQLLSHGIERIVMFTGNNDPKAPTFQRSRAYLETMEAAGLKGECHSLSGLNAPIRKREKIRQVLETGDWQGVFCSDDMTALLVEDVAQQLGWSIPEDLKLVGYDGTDFIESYVPRLTTIQQPIQAMANLCVDLLLEQIGGASFSQERYELAVQLIKAQTA